MAQTIKTTYKIIRNRYELNRLVTFAKTSDQAIGYYMIFTFWFLWLWLCAVPSVLFAGILSTLGV